MSGVRSWLLVPLLVAPGLTQDPVEEATGYRGVPGAVMLCGGGQLPYSITDTFFELAGGEDARLVVIPTASAASDGDDPRSALDPWRRRGPRSCRLLHARSRAEAESESALALLREATAVWITGGRQSRLARAYAETAVERELRALLARGGIIGGTSAGAAYMSRLMIESGNPRPRVSRGLDLLPGAIVDQHFAQREREPRLRAAVRANPGRFGVGIDESTAVLAQGRRLRVLGRGQATLMLAAGAGRPAREWKLGRRGVADLVALQRGAELRRAGKAFPPSPAAVPRGTLILIGGGGLPRAAMERFVAAAGGPDAPIVVVPTAAGDRIGGRSRAASFLERFGARNVMVWHAQRRSQLEDPELLKPLRDARGIWFGGGRQWRLVDRYEGTKALELFHDVLRRGGVIGGSSAGTSIQAEYMVRGNPLGNRDMMAEGYERGFGFLPGCAVDQHFAQRRRFADMTALMKTWPQLLGIGVDESTGIVVTGSRFEVVGRNRVAVYDWSSGTRAGEGGRDHVSLGAGTRYDMAARAVVDG